VIPIDGWAHARVAAHGTTRLRPKSDGPSRRRCGRARVLRMSALPPPVLGTFREWRHPKARRSAGLRLTHSLDKGEVVSSILTGSTMILFWIFGSYGRASSGHLPRKFRKPSFRPLERLPGILHEIRVMAHRDRYQDHLTQAVLAFNRAASSSESPPVTHEHRIKRRTLMRTSSMAATILGNRLSGERLDSAAGRVMTGGSTARGTRRE